MPQDNSRSPVPLAIAVNADSLATWFPAASLAASPEASCCARGCDRRPRSHVGTFGSRRGDRPNISTEKKPATGFVAEPLGAMEYRCYATPGFAAQYFANGLSVQLALDAPAILFNPKDSLHDEFLDGLFGFRVDRYARHYLPAPGTLLDGVLAGVGYGLVPTVQARSTANANSLVDLAPSRPGVRDAVLAPLGCRAIPFTGDRAPCG